VWQALEEAGIKYNAVSGTSVGALNGAMMCMRDLGRATNIWKDIRFSDVIRLGDEAEEDFVRLVKGDAELNEIGEFLPHFMEIIKNRGLDVSPLREWVREVADCEKIRNSDVELFVTTMSLTDRKGLEIKINDMSDDEICDMLLASAYHPSFRQEKLGGKHYADGVFVDSLPIRVLVEHGYKDGDKGGQPLRDHRNAEPEGHREVSESDGDAVAQALFIRVSLLFHDSPASK